MKIIATLSLCVFASTMTSCVSNPTAFANNTQQTAEIVGFVVFYGEFQIYPSQASFEAKQSVCVSGALPLEAQRHAARSYDRKVVRVVGRLVAWPASGDLLSLNYDGSEIKNGCGGDQVVFASSIAEFEN